MAKVNFISAWYAPDGTYFYKGEQEVDDDLLEALPSTAKVLEGKKSAAKSAPEPK